MNDNRNRVLHILTSGHLSYGHYIVLNWPRMWASYPLLVIETTVLYLEHLKVCNFQRITCFTVASGDPGSSREVQFGSSLRSDDTNKAL